jgi:hypothetical protein
MKIFMENKHQIAKHNAAYEQGNNKFKLALNKYGDMVNVNLKSRLFLLVLKIFFIMYSVVPKP